MKTQHRCYQCNRVLTDLEIASYVPGYPFLTCNMCSSKAGREFVVTRDGKKFVSSDDVAKAIKANIDRMRKEVGISLEDLSERAGIGKNPWWRRLNGDVQFRADELCRVALVLDCGIEDFFLV